MIRCTNCSQDKELNEFYKSKQSRNGYTSWCKLCFCTNDKWRTNNKQKKLQLDREWRSNNPDYVSTYAKRWKQENMDRVLLYNKKREMTKRDQYIEDVHIDVLLEMDDGICQLCDEDVNPLDHHSYVMDHIIPLSKGGEHSYVNTQLAHRTCNSSKNNQLIEGTY